LELKPSVERRERERDAPEKTRAGGRDVFRILRAVEERKSLNDDVFFDVVAFEPSIRARRLSREEGRRCGQERQQKVWTQKRRLETRRSIGDQIRSRVARREEPKKLGRARGDFEARVDVEESHGGE